MSEFLNIVRDSLSMVDQGVVSPEEAENLIRSHALHTGLPGVEDSDFTTTTNWLQLRAFLQERSETWSIFESKFLTNLWADGTVPNVEAVRRSRAERATAVQLLSSSLEWLWRTGARPWALAGAAARLGAKVSEHLLEKP